MSLCKRFFLLSFIVFASLSAQGQAARSPFSTFGIGEPYGNSLIQNQGMAGVGVSQPQYWSVNNQNPALLVFNYYTVFQAGVVMESRTIKGDSISQENVNGNLNYLVTAFPVKANKWTTSVGLMPFTAVNFKMQYEQQVLDVNTQLPVDTINITEQGSGGLSQLYWANGVRLHKNFAVGLRATYLFGSINNDYSNSLPSSSDFEIPYVIGIEEQTYIRDFQFTGGLSFSKDSIGRKQDNRISIGMTYTFGTDLKAKRTTVFERRTSISDPVTSDTISQARGFLHMPAILTIGASYSKGIKWAVGTEFTMQDWAEFTSINDEDQTQLEKAWKFALGGEFTPDHLAYSNYFKRVTYRLGLSFEKYPYLIENDNMKMNALKDFGINFGLSLPAGRSSLDLAFRVGKRGSISDTVLEESYYKVYFGITFNDQWFIKRKFD